MKVKREIERAGNDPRLRRGIRLRFLVLLPLVAIIILWWDSSRFETVAYWDGASISPAIGQAYGWLRIEWIHYTPPSIAGDFGCAREALEDYSPGGFSLLGMMFPPAIDHTFSRVPEHSHNLTYVAWWLVFCVYLCFCVVLGLLWNRLRKERTRRSTTNPTALVGRRLD